ncbi:MAG: NADH-quinone oxidoreductase subunit NuoG [Solirubrobacterales bacterium]|nr:NADH-quinone oxidoreductase subunit NuoG [Solirubrobacterales bacterium]OJU95632.1 MAG: NADH dehydrogenase (quinone) subunit G [Solirubrobacterales bacterium 67-14]
MPAPKRNLITLTVDGREIEAVEGAMLVDAAKQGDIEIPVFCYEPKLGAPVGACRMCLVEIEGIPKLQTACSTPVRDGMVVHTRTEQVKEAQNAVVEFLLVNHPLDCPVCDKGGECPLQDISMGWGTDRSRVVDPKRHFEKPVPLSPLIAIDRERCILCYRCARFSQEVSEDGQLQLLERGAESYIGTFDDRPYIAPFQGNITELCPVGALTSYTYRFQARPWDIEQGGSVCTLCPSQCNVSFTIRDEQVKRVLDRENDAVDDGWLCDRGRYGFQAMYSQDRVMNPLRYVDGHPVPAQWGEALEAAQVGLAAAEGKVAALVGDASNEEAFMLQDLIRNGLGSNDIDSRQAPTIGRGQRVRLDDPATQARVADIDHADVVLVLGTDPIHSAPAFDLRVRKAVRRNGTALAVATERPSALDGGASEVERIAPGQSAAYLAGLLDQVKSGSTDGIAGLLKDSSHTVVIWGERIGRGVDGPAAIESLLELTAALDLAGQEESGLIEIPDVANARGLREVGCLPDAGPGLAEVEAGRDVDEIKAALTSGDLRAVVLYGVDPLRDFPDTEGWREALENADFVIHFTMASTDTTELSDVVFPLESHAEKDGTVTHTEGRLQRVRPAAARPGDIRGGWHVLAELSAALDHETGIHAVPEALKAITESVPFYAGITDAEIGGRGIRWQEREAASSWSLNSPAGAEGGTVGRTSPGVPPVPPSTPADGPDSGLILGTYRDLWANSTTDLSPALSYLIPAQRLEVSVADAERLGLSKGDEVAVKSGDTEVTAFVAVRAALPEGTCFLMEGTQQGNANVFTNGKPAVVEIGKASPKLEVLAGNGNGGE